MAWNELMICAPSHDVYSYNFFRLMAGFVKLDTTELYMLLVKYDLL
jgi:hypothetical protein